MNRIRYTVLQAESGVLRIEIVEDAFVTNLVLRRQTYNASDVRIRRRRRRCFHFAVARFIRHLQYSILNPIKNSKHTEIFRINR